MTSVRTGRALSLLRSCLAAGLRSIRRSLILRALVSCDTPLYGVRTPQGAIKIGRSATWDGVSLPIPCGRCLGCRSDLARSWAIRCVDESRLWEYSCFVTLTYDDKHLPDFESLQPDHLRDFFKRLRINRSREVSPQAVGLGSVSDNRIRYFAVGEYGGLSGRPHYHALIFNYRPADLRPGPGGYQESPYLSRVWTHGAVSVGEVTPESAAYCAGYSAKKLYGKRKRYHVDPTTGEAVAVFREFLRVSRAPAIGYAHAEKYIMDYRRGYVQRGEMKSPLPRYYKDKLGELDPTIIERIDKARDDYIGACDAPFSESETRKREGRAAARRTRNSLRKEHGL